MIVRPRLSDYYGIPMLQGEVDFAIPFMDEDIPLYVDPFLMWKSPSQMDNMLHDGILNAFNNLGQMYLGGEKEAAVNHMVFLSECDEVCQMITELQNQKMKVDQDLANEMLKHLVKINAKQM